MARDRGCRAGGQKLPSEIVATFEQFELRYEVVHCLFHVAEMLKTIRCRISVAGGIVNGNINMSI